MKLYAICKTCNNKFYIASSAKIRSNLPPLFYLTCPYRDTNQYNPQEVFAETSEGSMAIGGALAGGIVGLIAGGIGAIVGAILGGVLGGGREKQDIGAATRFNNS